MGSLFAKRRLTGASRQTAQDRRPDQRSRRHPKSVLAASSGSRGQHTAGKLTVANFDANLTAALSGHLLAGHVELFTASTGSLAGHTYLVVDANGVAGYQAGQDYVIELTSATHLGQLTTTAFI
jgi:hypothetical protein